jgi:hypothetical protein
MFELASKVDIAEHSPIIRRSQFMKQGRTPIPTFSTPATATAHVVAEAGYCLAPSPPTRRPLARPRPRPPGPRPPGPPPPPPPLPPRRSNDGIQACPAAGDDDDDDKGDIGLPTVPSDNEPKAVTALALFGGGFGPSEITVGSVDHISHGKESRCLAS